MKVHLRWIPNDDVAIIGDSEAIKRDLRSLIGELNAWESEGAEEVFVDFNTNGFHVTFMKFDEITTKALLDNGIDTIPAPEGE